MTTEIIEEVLVVLMFFVFWLLRNTPLGFLWRWTKIFFTVLILTLFATKIKNDLKDWWNEK